MTGGIARPGAADPAARRAAGDPALRASIERELHDDLLPFWRQRSVDVDRGGFLGEISHDGTPVPDAAKGLILNARILWAFAALYRRLGDPRDEELMQRAADYLQSRFHDRRNGGYHWRVDADGRPLDSSKKIYGQAFCVYAWSEHYLATGNAGSLAAAHEAWDLIERHARDPRHGGYLEARAADWSAADDLRLSPGDLDAPKSMNTHLHLLEAATNLHRARPDVAVAARLRELLDLFGAHILDHPTPGAVAGPGVWHLRHFFDEAWKPLSEGYTYGHDIEAAWLLGEAADALRDEASKG
jgi:mannobiose 2-epimerase